jgi:hypothetical protein
MTTPTKKYDQIEVGDLVRVKVWSDLYFYDIVVDVHYINDFPCYFYTATKNKMPYAVKETLMILT